MTNLAILVLFIGGGFLLAAVRYQLDFVSFVICLAVTVAIILALWRLIEWHYGGGR